MNKSKYNVKKASKIAKLSYQWCENRFGHPLKTVICNFKVSQDKRVKHMLGEYMDRDIKIYIENCRSYSEVIRTVIHEYTHYLQMPKLTDNRKYYKLDEKHGYINNPMEVEARDAEDNYIGTCRGYVYSKLQKSKKKY